MFQIEGLVGGTVDPIERYDKREPRIGQTEVS